MNAKEQGRAVGMSAIYASKASEGRGRLFEEEEHALRSPFQRDRDRIIHSSAFRRLKHKTQVFVEHEGDYFRTRLTHSIEVAQVARTISGVLKLNCELSEAIALAHDLGHTPFGHTGEEALDTLMQGFGGFDHNAQAIQIVTSLERHYARWDGLNLSWETLEGLAKHNGPVLSEVEKAIPYALAEYSARHDLELETYASAEAQVAALADDIAYNHHDIHDGIRAGLIHVEDVVKLPILDRCFAQVDDLYPNLESNRRQYEALRRFFAVLVEDVIDTSTHHLQNVSPQSVEDIRHAGRPVIQFSPALWADLKEVRRFLFTHMYRAPSVVKMREEVTQVVRDLFSALLKHPEHLPSQWREEMRSLKDEVQLARHISDYISGMTDRFALQEHERLLK